MTVKLKVFSEQSIWNLEENVNDFIKKHDSSCSVINFTTDENYHYAALTYFEDEPEEEKKTTRYFTCEMTDEELQEMKENPLAYSTNNNFKQIEPTNINRIAR